MADSEESDSSDSDAENPQDPVGVAGLPLPEDEDAAEHSDLVIRPVERSNEGHEPAEGRQVADPIAGEPSAGPVVEGNQEANRATQRDVVIAGGSYENAFFGPQTSSNNYEVKQYKNATVQEVHHHYHDSQPDSEASTSGHQAPKRRRVEESVTVEEEGYIRICDDTIMYEKEPIRRGISIYKGFQEHVSEDGTPNKLPVAVKKIVPSEPRQKREIKHLVQLASHPNVVRIIRSKEHKTPHASVLYIIMELCSVQNLQDYLEENRRNNTPFDFKKTMEFTKQLLSGMKHIHDNDVVHRDVKPDNILLSEDKTLVKFSDFGLGKKLHDGHTSTMVTVQGQGSVGYRAPETYSSDKVSKKADIFSFGVTLFGLWSNGNHPFGANIRLRDNNIITNTNHDFSGLLITGSLRTDFIEMIKLMIQHDPNLRPTIDAIIKHFFFKNAMAQMRRETAKPAISEVIRPNEFGPIPAAAEDTEPKEPGSSRGPRTQLSSGEGAVALSGRTFFAREERASRLRQEHQYEDAIALLADSETNERQQTILAECYFHVGRDADATQCMERLKTIIPSAPDHPKPDEAIKKVESHIDNSLFIQALILLPSVAEICRQDSEPKDALWGFVLCIWRGSDIVRSLYRQGGRMQTISKTVAINTLHQIMMPWKTTQELMTIQRLIWQHDASTISALRIFQSKTMRNL